MKTSLFQSDLVKSHRIIYTPSIFAKTNLLYLQETGYLEAQKSHISKRDNLSSFLFFIVTKGTGTLTYNKNTYYLQSGDCVLIDCKKPYAHQSSSDLWHLKWAHFYGSNTKAIYQKYQERGGLPTFHTKNFSSYNILLDNLYNIADSTQYIRDMKIYEQLTHLLTLLMEESWNEEKINKNISSKLNLQTIKDYLDNNYQNKITLDNLSEIFYINKYYLTRIFKEQFGISIIDYLLQVRITHAKQLLRFTSLNIEKVGNECGIPDANYFTRAFKKIESITPKDYRNRWY